MALTDQLAAQRTYVMLRQRGIPVDANFIARAIAQMPDALETLCKRIASSNDFHNGQKDFDLTAAAGRIDLGASGADTMLFDPFKARVFVGASDDPAVYIERMETLKNGGLPNDTYHFTHRGQKLTFLNIDGQTNTLAGAVKVTANYIWAIGEVPREYYVELFETLAELASGDPRIAAMNSASADRGVEVGRV